MMLMKRTLESSLYKMRNLQNIRRVKNVTKLNSRRREQGVTDPVLLGPDKIESDRSICSKVLSLITPLHHAAPASNQ